MSTFIPTVCWPLAAGGLAVGLLLGGCARPAGADPSRVAATPLAVAAPARCSRPHGDAESAALRQAMWRQCGADLQGSRHACLRELMIACG